MSYNPADPAVVLVGKRVKSSNDEDARRFHGQIANMTGKLFDASYKGTLYPIDPSKNLEVGATTIKIVPVGATPTLGSVVASKKVTVTATVNSERKTARDSDKSVEVVVDGVSHDLSYLAKPFEMVVGPLSTITIKWREDEIEIFEIKAV